MPVRRHHSKSRHGCTQCKARKTKCDEQRPVCGSCSRRNVTCSLQEGGASLIFVDGPKLQTSRRQSNTPGQGVLKLGASSGNEASSSSNAIRSPDESILMTPPSTHIATNSPTASQSAPSQADAPTESTMKAMTISRPDRDNLLLMRHYSVSTFNRIFGGFDTLPVWRDHIPALALENDYLLHGLLAVSALHMRLEPPTKPARSPSAENAPAKEPIPPPVLSQPPLELAINHHDRSLGLFRSALGAPTAESARPLFAYSCLLTVYAFGINQSSIAPPDQDDLAAIADIIGLLRGCSSIVEHSKQHLVDGPLQPLLLPDPRDPYRQLPDAIEAVLRSLRARIDAAATAGGSAAQQQQSWKPAAALDEWHRMHVDALGLVRLTFILAVENPGAQMVAVPFGVLCEAEVVRGFREREPIALALVAHWAVVLWWLRGSMWVGDWGRRVVEAIAKELEGVEGGWRKEVEWAVAEVRKDEGVEWGSGRGIKV